MTLKSLKLRFAALVGLAALVALAVASQASAATLAGPWAPFTNCPVNEPAFNNYPYRAYGAACVNASSPGGSLTIGKTTVQTGSQIIQFGVPGSEPSENFIGHIVPATENQTLVAAPAQVPGGLVGLICPSNVALVTALCETATNNGLNNVYATAELAGTPSHFNLFAGLTTGVPILTLPVKIHLANPLLGSSCYIGTQQEPIVLHPAGVKKGTQAPFETDPNGYSVGFLKIVGATQGDSTFAVPGASGCGGPLLSAVVDAAIDLKQALPSPAGKNDLVLDEATSSIARASGSEGQTILREAWTASCLTGCS